MDTPLRAAEARLAKVAGLCALIYGGLGIAFVATPQRLFQLASLAFLQQRDEGPFGQLAAALHHGAGVSPFARFLALLAASGFFALATSCFLVARAPQRRRVLMAAPIAAKLSAGVLASIWALGGAGPAFVVLALTDLGAGLYTLLVVRGAAPGVSQVARGAASPAPAPPGTVQLGTR